MTSLRIRGIVATDLRGPAQHRTGETIVRATDFGMAGNHNMRDKPDTVTQSNVGSHAAERTDVDIRAQKRAVFNDRRWMNCHLRRQVSWR